jgi:hypothetical protein
MIHTVIKVTKENGCVAIELAGERGLMLSAITSMLIKISDMASEPLINILADIYMNAMIQGAVKGEGFDQALFGLMKQVLKQDEEKKSKRKQETEA